MAEDQAPVPTSTPPGPPSYHDYRPPRTTAEGGATMLISGAFVAGAVIALLLGVYSKVTETAYFGQVTNLLLFSVALLLLGLYTLAWEIALRLISRTED